MTGVGDIQDLFLPADTLLAGRRYVVSRQKSVSYAYPSFPFRLLYPQVHLPDAVRSS